MNKATLNLIPFLSQLLVEAPQLIDTVHGLFVQHSLGTEEDFAAIRAEARGIAVKLGHPDDYFGPVAVPPPPPPQPIGFPSYNAWISNDPGDMPLRNGDAVYSRDSLWYVNQGGKIAFGQPGLPGPADLVRIVSK